VGTNTEEIAPFNCTGAEQERESCGSIGTHNIVLSIFTLENMRRMPRTTFFLMTLTTTNLFSLRFLSAAGPEQVGHMGDGPRLVRFLQKA